MDPPDQPQESPTLMQGSENRVSTSHIQDEESGFLPRIERVFPIRVDVLSRKQSAQGRQKSAVLTVYKSLMLRIHSRLNAWLPS